MICNTCCHNVISYRVAFELFAQFCNVEDAPDGDDDGGDGDRGHDVAHEVHGAVGGAHAVRTELCLLLLFGWIAAAGVIFYHRHGF